MDNLEQSELFQALATQNQQLAQSTALCWKEAQKVLRLVPATHPQFTSHGPDHALALLAILDNAVAGLTLGLTADELYILIAATLLHDIGMAGPAPSPPNVAGQIRQDHHIRTLHFIEQHGREYHLDTQYVQAIARVAAAHRKIDIARDIPESPIGITNAPSPRARMCAALLRLADECHITDDRVPADYGHLKLSPISLQHFSSHLATTGIGFNSDSGVITFSVKVESCEMDTFLQAAKRKIQAELNGLQTIFERNGIPYSVIEFSEIRDDLISRKTVRVLLEDASVNHADLVDKLVATGEGSQAAEAFLRTYSNADPFMAEGDDALSTYRLRPNSFIKLAERWLERPTEEDAVIFVRSSLVQDALSDDYLTKNIGPHLAMNTREAAFRIIRNSPSALKYAFALRDSTPIRKPGAAGGTFRALVGGLESDFVAHPDLLLVPGLLDEVFASGKLDKDDWEKWRVHQICEYHKAFAEETIIEQWMTGNEWERKADRGYSLAKHHGKISYRGKREYDSPFALWAAAGRLGVPFTVESFDGAAVSLTMDGANARETSEPDGGYAITIGPGEGGFAKVEVPASIKKEGASKYVVEVCESALGEDSQHAIRLFIEHPQHKHGEELPTHFQIHVDHERLDCAQASVLAVGSNPASLWLRYEPGRPPKRVEEKALLGPLLADLYRTDFLRVVRRLGQIQRLRGVPIPFPMFGVPSKVRKLLMRKPIRSKQRAVAIWAKIEQLMEEEEEDCFTPMHFEIRHRSRLLRRKYLGYYAGPRQPRISGRFEGPAIEKTQRVVDDALDDLKKEIKLQFSVSLSPSAALALVEATTRDVGHRKVVDPFSLAKWKCSGVADAKSHCDMAWLPAIDRFWHRSTPLVVTLEGYPSWVRWKQESLELDAMGDLRRSAIAAREAYRCAPGEDDVCIQYGWMAFKVGMLNEAVNATTRALQAGETSTRYLAKINMGLYRLAKAKTDPAQLGAALSAYTEALSDARELEAEHFKRAVGNAISDLREYSGLISPNHMTILPIFEKLQRGDCSIDGAIDEVSKVA